MFREREDEIARSDVGNFGLVMSRAFSKYG